MNNATTTETAGAPAQTGETPDPVPAAAVATVAPDQAAAEGVPAQAGETPDPVPTALGCPCHPNHKKETTMSQALNTIHPKTRAEMLADKQYHLNELDRARTAGDWDDADYHRKAAEALLAQTRRWRR